MEKIISESLAQCESSLSQLAGDRGQHRHIANAARLLIDTFKNGGRVYSCGNGGSMCDAMHFAEELSGRFRNNRAPLPAMSISDVSHLTCVGNDYGFEHVFSRFVEAHGKSKDCLVAISTSGKSPNIIAAAKVAKERDMRIIALTGKAPSPLSELADVTIAAPGTSGYSDRIQEIHIKCIHILIELVESEIF